MSHSSPRPYTFRLDDVLREQLEQEAKLEDRPTSQLVNWAIKAWLSNRHYKREAIKTAVAEANEGNFISQRAMHQWFDTWGTANETEIPTADIISQ